MTRCKNQYIVRESARGAVFERLKHGHCLLLLYQLGRAQLVRQRVDPFTALKVPLAFSSEHVGKQASQ